MKRLILGIVVGNIATIAIVISLTAFAQDKIVSSLRPLLVDIQQVVPIFADVVIPLENGNTVTTTVPLTVNVSLQIGLSGIASNSVKIQQKAVPTIGVNEPIVVSTSTPTVLATQSIQPAQKVPNTETIEFSEIVRNPDALGWTDVKFNEYKKSIKGLKAENWQGNVENVQQSINGDYYIEIDMLETEDSLDVYLYTEKETALLFGKGQSIMFSGTIDGLYPSVFGDWRVEVKGAITNADETSDPVKLITQTFSTGDTLDFNEIIRNPSNLRWTSAQFDEYRKKLYGFQIENWHGSVVDVKQTVVSSEYYIEVDIPNTQDEVDVFIYVPQKIAVELIKGQEIRFSGRIVGLYNQLFGDYQVEIRDAIIL